MLPEALRAALVGPIAFPVTPFQNDRSLNLPALRRNVHAILQHPPAAIVAAGGTGELYSLTPAEHHDVVAAVVDEARGRVPVIAGVGFNAAIAEAMARDAARIGAHGILAFPPYYPQPDDDGLIEYYRAIGSATPLGLLIYSRDWFHPGPAFVRRLAGIPSLVAWKEGQGDIRRLQTLMGALGDRLCWVGGAGDDMVPAYYAAGVRAYTSSVSNVSSKIARELHERGASGGAALEQLMAELVVPLYTVRGRRRGYEVTVMKALMNAVGLEGGVVRPPLPHLTAQDQRDVEDMASRWRVAM